MKTGGLDTARKLKRLTKGGATTSAVDSEPDQLTDALAGLSLNKPPQGKFAAKVASLRKIADWSSSDEEYDSPTAEPEVNVGDNSRSKAGTAGFCSRSRGLLSPSFAQASNDSEGPSDSGGPGDAGDMVLGENQEFRLAGRVAGKLYAHQIKGVEWLWSLHALKKGGILADDMGLGKTMQCSAFLTGMLQSGLIRRALVVAPKTLLAQWRKELSTCGILHQTHELAPSSSHRERDTQLSKVFDRPGVLLTTYGMVQHNAQLLCQPPGGDHEEGDPPLWDFLILDEGHKIKNEKTVIAQQLRRIPVAVSVIISGTPIQNNLMELHSLFDFVNPGLLGDARFFKLEYEHVITRGNSRDASQRDRDLAGGRSKALRDRYAPFFLRREKKEVLQQDASSDVEAGASASTIPVPQKMGRKNDLVIWLKLQPQQRRIYMAFLNSQAVKDALNRSNSPLAAITVLKKICVHPYLLNERAIDAVAAAGKKLSKAGRSGMDDFIVDDDSDSGYETASSQDASDDGGLELEWAGEDAEGKLRELIKSKGAAASCKSAFVARLVQELQAAGHRTLIFSQSRVMLDIMGDELKRQRMRFSRIDGSMSAASREDAVQQFQSRADIPAMLLTSQVGGLGLTLTAADRVIILDPAWNPATDAQSVDRAYRIGQSKDVVVYRLISCGTVEEKIYRKQVFKGGLFRRGMEDGAPFQYFSQQELRDLFTASHEDLQHSATQQQLHELHAAERKATPALESHLSLLESLPCYSGVSDHDLLYSQKGSEVISAMEPAAQFPGARTLPGRAPVAAKAPARGGRNYGRGWGGGGDISDMLASSLRLDGASAAAAKPPGFEWAEQRTNPPAGRQTADLKAVREQQQRLQKLLAATGSRLPDRGAQLRRRIQELEAKLAAPEAGPPATLQPPQDVPAVTDLSTSGKGNARTIQMPGAASVRLPSQEELDKQQAEGRAADDSLPATKVGGGRVHESAATAVQPSPDRGPEGHSGSGPRQPAPAAQSSMSTPSTAPRALDAALLTPFPDDIPEVQQQTPAGCPQEAGEKPAELTRLRKESTALKSRIRELLTVLEDPVAKSSLTDGGKQLKKEAKALDRQRKAIKENIDRLQPSR